MSSKDVAQGISWSRNENISAAKMKTKEEQIHSQEHGNMGQDRQSPVQEEHGPKFGRRRTSVSLCKPGEDSRTEKPCNRTDGALPQQPINSSISHQIIIDLKNSERMEEPHSRVIDTVDGDSGADISKSVDLSAPVGMDELDSELARAAGGASKDQATFDPYECGQGATTNTPVTGLTDYICHQIQGRGLTTSSQDNIYQHAISIMKKRCVKTNRTTTNPRKFIHRRKTPDNIVRQKTPENIVEEDGTTFPNFSLPAIVANMDKSPLGQMANCFIYVTQRRQQPIPPVKAWKGYKGNIYFEPVVCKKAGLTQPSSPRNNAHIKAVHEACSYRPSTTNPAEKTKAAQLPVLPQKEVTSVQDSPEFVKDRNVTIPNRQKSTPGTLSTAKSRVNTSRQLAVLDKQSVFSRMDSNLPEDLKWISGLEAMGTLHLGGLKLQRSTAHFYENTRKHHKLRIQRGLVSHQLANDDNSLSTLLGVHGGKLNDSADSIAKTNHLQSQYQICRVPQQSVDDIFDDFSGPFTSIEQLRRDSPSSLRRANSSCSSDRMVKDDSLHSMTSIYKHTKRNVPLYSSKEVLFRNREALFLSRPNYR